MFIFPSLLLVVVYMVSAVMLVGIIALGVYLGLTFYYKKNPINDLKKKINQTINNKER